jgi:hypothetical protein
MNALHGPLAGVQGTASLRIPGGRVILSESIKVAQ